MESLGKWILEHDDRWSFIIVYIGGAILLSIYAGLFWVAMLMVAHFLLELSKQILVKSVQPFFHALWEIKLDIALFLFALIIVLYSDTVMAALGLGHAARAGHAAKAVRSAQVFTRFGIIQRSLRVFLLVMDDLAKFCLAVWKGFKRAQNGGELQEQPVYATLQEAVAEQNPPPWQQATKGDYISLGFGTVCLVLLFLAPMLTGVTPAFAIEAVLSELHP